MEDILEQVNKEIEDFFLADLVENENYEEAGELLKYIRNL